MSFEDEEKLPKFTSYAALTTFRKTGPFLKHSFCTIHDCIHIAAYKDITIYFCYFSFGSFLSVYRWSKIFTSGLKIEFLTELLEVGLGRQFGDSDVDAGPAGGAQVGGTEGQIAQLIVVGEGQLLLHGLNCL